ncbi:6536_t:CDS:1 [Ambispora gerdemannii]|uniref:6536_t:CDS:1 n=1 Tax=Ambispora gerdemannii TaxID=144530 RepID=A0A9N9ES50_9GLOM|nr:6536_t:CDS:1 [Ambispora gerdemannii]
MYTKNNNNFLINDDPISTSPQKLHRRDDHNNTTTQTNDILKIGLAIVLFLLLFLMISYATIVAVRRKRNLISSSPGHKKRVSIYLWQKNLVFSHSRSRSTGSSLLDHNQQQQINQGKERGGVRRGLRLDVIKEDGKVTLSPMKEEEEGGLSGSLPESAIEKIEAKAECDDESFVMVSNV